MKESNNKKSLIYSIIIPHKNIPSLLKRCLDSIPIRDDTEIIVVDDNSSDAVILKLKNIEKYRQDLRIIYLEDSVGGGAARNIGLQNVHSKWVLFADSDDFFNYCVNDILDEYKDSDADIVYFNANSVDSELYTTTYRTNHLNAFIKDFNITGNELSLRYLFGEPWCKLVSFNIIKDNHIEFEETSIHNDTAFSYLVGFYAKKILADNRALYCVTTRPNSVSVTLSESKKVERIGVFGRAAKFFLLNEIPVRERRHYNQLFDSYFYNKETYKQGIALLNSIGYSSLEIKKGLIRACYEKIVNIVKLPLRCMLHILLKRYI